MNNLSIADIDNNMAYTFAVTVKYQISRLKITDGYGCSHCCLNTCTSRNRITEVQINLLGETGTVNTFCQAVRGRLIPNAAYTPLTNPEQSVPFVRLLPP